MPLRLCLKVLALGLCLAATAACSKGTDPKLTAAQKASDTFLALGKDAAKSGSPPRQSDPAVAPLLDAIFDASDLEAGEGVPYDAMQPLNERMLIGARTGLVYILAGTGVSDIGEIGNNQAVLDQVNRNTVAFAPELARYFDFQLKVQRALVDAVLARFGSAPQDELDKPNIKSGLAQIRAGTLVAIKGVLETLPMEGMSDDWRRARLLPLSAIAPKLAKFLDKDQREELRQSAVAAAGAVSDGEVRDGLQAFAATVAAAN